MRQAAAAICLLAAAQTLSLKVEAAGPLKSDAAAEALRSALESNGVRLSIDGRPFCELWLRQSIPAEKGGASETLYPDFAVSTAVGVIRFAAPATDFRGQAIPAGLYTLRYALPPNDGSHLGVSDSLDYLLLLRMTDDSNPNAKMKPEELFESSRRVTGTKHPGVFNLTRPSGANFPEAYINEKGHVVLQVKAKLSTGADLPVALVVKGQAEQ